jgi:DNA polymerase
VYDILNAGPRHRFTVRSGPTGRPFVVSNCVQALTRDVLVVGLRRLHRAGFNLVGHAHDEAKAIQKIGDNYYTLERMRQEMTAPIDWLPDFPLNAAGWVGPYYRK